MTSGHVDLNRFIVQQLEAQYRTIRLATDDLTDEQWYSLASLWAEKSRGDPGHCGGPHLKLLSRQRTSVP